MNGKDIIADDISMDKFKYLKTPYERYIHELNEEIDYIEYIYELEINYKIEFYGSNNNLERSLTPKYQRVNEFIIDFLNNLMSVGRS